MSSSLPPTPSHARHAAFTLIELLTVVAIVGILASILFPVIGKVRAAAREVQCQTNLRQWGQMFLIYATDHKGSYTYYGWADDSSDGPYTPYFANGHYLMSQLRACPLLPSAQIAAGTLTYCIIRPLIHGALVSGNSNVQINCASNPGQFLMLCDSMPNSSTYMTSSATSINSLVGPLFNPSTAAAGDQVYASRHGGNHINGVFGDGSVRRITGSPATSNDNNSIYAMASTWFSLY